MTAIRYNERTVLIILLLTVLSTSFAWAGDAAVRNVIGFSPDGRTFAFEQFGTQDGSGFPYAEIFIIDSQDDSWVPGTPVRKRLETENATVDQAREAARAEAQPILSTRQIGEPGDHLASNPRAELSADPHSVLVNAAHRFVPPAEDPVTFTLAEKPFASAECAKVTELPTKGFALKMERPGKPEIMLHDDTALPASRGCPLGYAIADVLAHEAGGHTTYAVLLHVASHGFEGPDSRFIAVTRRLP